jgi:hypothetical protein
MKNIADHMIELIEIEDFVRRLHPTYAKHDIPHDVIDIWSVTPYLSWKLQEAGCTSYEYSFHRPFPLYIWFVRGGDISKLKAVW